MALESAGKELNSRPAGQATLNSFNDLDIMGRVIGEEIYCLKV